MSASIPYVISYQTQHAIILQLLRIIIKLVMIMTHQIAFHHQVSLNDSMISFIMDIARRTNLWPCIDKCLYRSKRTTTTCLTLLTTLVSHSILLLCLRSPDLVIIVVHGRHTEKQAATVTPCASAQGN